jgi:6-phosphogluconolactonase (cycloisomerase 2 family)
MKVFAYHKGVLSNETSVAPNGGFGFQPRHVAFGAWRVYLAVERQNQLQVYERRGLFALEPLPKFRWTGEPTLIQNADTRGFVPRTISFDRTGNIMIAANQSARNVLNDDGTITAVPTSIAVFRIRHDGTLHYVRKYDNAGGTWAGFLGAP